MARAKKPTKKELDLLANIVEATNSESGMLFVAESETTKLVELGLVEINVTMTDEDGNVATRATEEGMSTMNQTTENASAEATETKSTTSSNISVEIESGIPVPADGRVGYARYPFDNMEVGDSFHIAKTEDVPNPVKRMASSVSGATARYKDENGNKTKIFVCRKVGEDDPKGSGCRVFRTQ